MMSGLTDQQRTQAIAGHFSSIIELIGENPRREGLKETPLRAARAFQHLTNGYHTSIDRLINQAIFKSDMSEMIVVKNIELYSLCQHHLLPFIGKCHVAYIPEGNVIGLSKVARIVDVYAQRLQLQEQLTQQIAEAICAVTQAKGVGVIIEAKHLCMMMRGVEKQNSVMATSVMLGNFRSDERTRSEFLSLAK